ncbi:MAG: PKD domain-containing protein [Candidatus Methanosuratincola petrocarbonis]
MIDLSKFLSPLLPLLIVFTILLAAMPSSLCSEDLPSIISESGTVYLYHNMTAGEVEYFRDCFASIPPSNAIIGGHGTGLAPPDEEGWSALAGSVVIDYALPGAPMASSRRLDLDPYFPLIGDQGIQGSCAAWASVYYAGTYLQAKAHGWSDVKANPAHVMSPAWTYNKLNGGVDGGSWCDRNMQLVSEIGSASMATMPYNQYDWLSWGGESAWREAPLYRAGGFATIRPDNIDTIKALINDGYLVTFYIDASCPWYSSSDTILSYAEYTGGTPNHANVIVGYDDSITDGTDQGAFRVANSWGTGFKDAGFYWITYRTMNKISSYSPIANSYLPKDGGISYEPLVLATWQLDPAGSLDGAAVRVGVGAPESPIASKTPSEYWTAGKNSKIPNFMCIDITELKPYIDSGNGEFFLTVGRGSAASRITSFTIEIYSDYSLPPSLVYSSREVPAWSPVTIAITERPSVIFSWSPFSPLTFEPVYFTDSSSSYNGTIVSWYWSFGDGTHSASKNPVHSYSSHGQFAISLTVMDSNGLSSTRSQTISVRNRLPEVTIVSPEGGGLFSGVVELAANGSDLDDGIAKVDFFYSVGDQVYFIGTNRTAMREGTWTLQWNTSPLTISGIRVFAVAFDGFDYSERSYLDRPISLDNTPPTQPSPRSPKQGLRTDGSVQLSWEQATDIGSGILGYAVELHGAQAGSADPILIETEGTHCQVDLSSGMWVWHVRAIDLAGNKGEWSPSSNFIADSFLVNESGSSSRRADLGSEQVVWFRVFYQYDGMPFTPSNGSVFINGSPASWNGDLDRWELPITRTLVGESVMYVSTVQDNHNPVTKINRTAPPPSIVFDQIIIDRIEPDGLRIQVGRQVNFSVFGHYAYDSDEWAGGFVLNESSVKGSLGRYYYSVESVTDDLYNLTGFVQICNPASVVFDQILSSVDHSTSRPGECAVSVRLSYASDGSPVTGASVSINGKQAEELGYGNYALRLESFLPYMTVRSEVEAQNFDAIVNEEGVLMTGNALVYAAFASAVALSLAFLARRAHSKPS